MKILSTNPANVKHLIGAILILYSIYFNPLILKRRRT